MAVREYQIAQIFVVARIRFVICRLRLTVWYDKTFVIHLQFTQHPGQRHGRSPLDWSRKTGSIAHAPGSRQESMRNSNTFAPPLRKNRSATWDVYQAYSINFSSDHTPRKPCRRECLLPFTYVSKTYSSSPGVWIAYECPAT